MSVFFARFANSRKRRIWRSVAHARKHLQELGGPEPQLPPFDASKFEPMPDVELNPKDEF
jgi:hypothetical protein